MAPETWLLLLAAGVVGGLVSVLVSMASLVTYPALLAAGLPPVAANVTNTVALVLNGTGATLGSRPELRGQGPLIRALAPVALVGGAVGAALLLVLPPRWFELVAPALVGAASLLLVLQPRLRGLPPLRPRGVTPGARVALVLVAAYIGYFGAAGGILALVVLGTVSDRPLAHLNAAKGVLALAANSVAAITFALAGPVAWGHALPLALGVLAGGLAGPWVVRRVPATLLRAVIGTGGIATAGALARAAWLGA